MRFYKDFELEREGDVFKAQVTLIFNRDFEEIEIHCAHDPRTGAKVELTNGEKRRIDELKWGWLESEKAERAFEKADQAYDLEHGK